MEPPESMEYDSDPEEPPSSLLEDIDDTANSETTRYPTTTATAPSDEGPWIEVSRSRSRNHSGGVNRDAGGGGDTLSLPKRRYIPLLPPTKLLCNYIPPHDPYNNLGFVDRMRKMRMMYGIPDSGGDAIHKFAYSTARDTRLRIAYWNMYFVDVNMLIVGDRNKNQGSVVRDMRFEDGEDAHMNLPFSFESSDIGRRKDDERDVRHERGHLMPAGINYWSERAMKECNLMINMTPQRAYHNQGYWNHLEMYERHLANNNEGIWTLIVPAFLSEGKGIQKVTYNLVGNSVAEPTHYIKVILVMKWGGSHFLQVFCIPHSANYEADKKRNKARHLKDFLMHNLDEVARCLGFHPFRDFDRNDLESVSEAKQTFTGNYKGAKSLSLQQFKIERDT